MKPHSLIRNMDFLKQPTDFSSFVVSCTDIDFECDFAGTVFVRGEFKRVGSDLPTGQRIGAENWVNGMGKEHHAFFVVAHHDVDAPEPITSYDLKVSYVLYRLPGMSSTRRVDYSQREDRYSFDEFLYNLLIKFGLSDKLKGSTGVEQDWLEDEILTAVHDCPFAMSHRRLFMRRLASKLTYQRGELWAFPDELTSDEIRQLRQH